MNIIHHAWGALALSTLAASVLAGSLQVTVLDKEGKPTPDAVVIVVPSAKGTAKNSPPMQATINQEKMQFIPAVTVVSPGAKLRFVNNDPWDHHVRMSVPGLPAAGASEGIALRLEGKSEGKAAKSVEVALDKPGGASGAGASSGSSGVSGVSGTGPMGATLLGCHIHGSMSGHVYVADSPWTLKTGADGVATLEDVPEGAATVKVWHSAQVVGMSPQTISVGATPGKVTVQLDVVPRRRRAASSVTYY